MDFDDTLTADAALSLAYLEATKKLGHRMVCMTARRDTEENRETIENWMVSHCVRMPVYFTNLGSKVEYAKKIGLKVDIWIDDDPKRCAMGH